MHTLTHRAWRFTLVTAAAAALALPIACSRQRDPATPEEKSARGDQLLRQMSDALKNAKAFSFTVNESHERVRRNGQKEPYTLTRDIVVRRPDRLYNHTRGSDSRDLELRYDGKQITIVGNRLKVYATVPAPASLDEMLDLISERYDLRVAVADLLYSVPYDSFAVSEAKGGWRRKIDVDGRACDEMSYAMTAVSLTLSVSSQPPVLPCQARIEYTQEPGVPVTTLVFSRWNLHAVPGDTQFAANVPEGYEAIPVVERIPKTELKSNPAKAMDAARK
jgi:hypothetical protein